MTTLRIRFHTFKAADKMFCPAISHRLIECAQRCEIYSSERHIALSSRKLESFILFDKICPFAAGIEAQFSLP